MPRRFIQFPILSLELRHLDAQNKLLLLRLRVHLLDGLHLGRRRGLLLREGRTGGEDQDEGESLHLAGSFKKVPVLLSSQAERDRGNIDCHQPTYRPARE